MTAQEWRGISEVVLSALERDISDINLVFVIGRNDAEANQGNLALGFILAREIVHLIEDLPGEGLRSPGLLKRVGDLHRAPGLESPGETPPKP
ncbi:hypothetical protein [Synechococcus sp. CCAP 1479/10]|uniref:hypothetical protein n=1 Tax=Synechococcus sp. CCAP 1479/10 TaxID=1221594 RepID=UPI001C21DE66|nr:hypothetical protein [Synechococcus sp. CCAP 1479/10]